MRQHHVNMSFWLNRYPISIGNAASKLNGLILHISIANICQCSPRLFPAPLSVRQTEPDSRSLALETRIAADPASRVEYVRAVVTHKVAVRGRGQLGTIHLLAPTSITNVWTCLFYFVKFSISCINATRMFHWWFQTDRYGLLTFRLLVQNQAYSDICLLKGFLGKMFGPLVDKGCKIWSHQAAGWVCRYQMDKLKLGKVGSKASAGSIIPVFHFGKMYNADFLLMNVYK